MAKDYAVTDQEEETGINPANSRVERGWRVYWRDSITGIQGSTFVPLSAYTAEGVDTLIEHQLVTVREVHTLGS